jgi:4-amino-4-deoxy-L-arabinose transferase-like glycosyltransferase
LAIVVLLILAALWAALLLPPYLRNRSENRPADSIGDFRHQLRVLQRTGPASVRPANRLWGPTPSHPVPPYSPYAARSAAFAPTATRRVGPSRLMSPELQRRRAAQRRRRDIFLSLTAMTGLSGLIGFVPGLSAVWYLTGVMAMALIGYTMLLVRMRNTAAEREMKVRFLGSAASGEPAPAYVLRRSAN